MSSSIEIKPCPFCNSVNTSIEHLSRPMTLYFVRCNECGAQGPYKLTPTVVGEFDNEIIAAWNNQFSNKKAQRLVAIKESKEPTLLLNVPASDNDRDQTNLAFNIDQGFCMERKGEEFTGVELFIASDYYTYGWLAAIELYAPDKAITEHRRDINLP